jgi:hypothetical protein
MWFGVSAPLVLLGSYWGLKAEPFNIPVRVNQVSSLHFHMLYCFSCYGCPDCGYCDYYYKHHDWQYLLYYCVSTVSILLRLLLPALLVHTYHELRFFSQSCSSSKGLIFINKRCRIVIEERLDRLLQ